MKKYFIIFILISHSICAYSADGLQKTRVTGDTLTQFITSQFLERDKEYTNKHSMYKKTLKELNEKLLVDALKGKNLTCSNQLYIELKWLINRTDDWSRAEKKLHELKQSLDDEKQDRFNQQDKNSAWGLCYTQWHLKLDDSLDKINTLSGFDKTPPIPLTFLHDIGTVEKLKKKLNETLISNIKQDGHNRRDELNVLITFLGQVIFKPSLKAYFQTYVKQIDLSQEYIDVFTQFLFNWQDLESGYFGAIYKTPDNQYIFAPDLSITYHLVSYTRGKLPKMKEIALTTLDIKDHEYPFGWKKNGFYVNHNNYDVVRIFARAYNKLPSTQQTKIRTAMQELLNWSTSESMDANGGFIFNQYFDNSIADTYYFGIQFLRHAGFWDSNKRFWTDQTFNQGNKICCGIKQAIKKNKVSKDTFLETYNYIKITCPVCEL